MPGYLLYLTDWLIPIQVSAGTSIVLGGMLGAALTGGIAALAVRGGEAELHSGDVSPRIDCP